MRPAVNGLAPRIWRAECSQTVHYPPRPYTTFTPRPRKLTRPSHQQIRSASSEAGAEQLGKTGLYELHKKYGAKFVPFGGYSMPVQYSDMSIIDSHNWTREKASLFDVGHMYGQMHCSLHAKLGNIRLTNTIPGSSTTFLALAPKPSWRASHHRHFLHCPSISPHYQPYCIPLAALWMTQSSPV